MKDVTSANLDVSPKLVQRVELHFQPIKLGLHILPVFSRGWVAGLGRIDERYLHSDGKGVCDPIRVLMFVHYYYDFKGNKQRMKEVGKYNPKELQRTHTSTHACTNARAHTFHVEHSLILISTFLIQMYTRTPYGSTHWTRTLIKHVSFKELQYSDNYSDNDLKLYTLTPTHSLSAPHPCTPKWIARKSNNPIKRTI